MKIKPQERQINLDDIWAHDALERQALADKFTNLIAGIKDSGVISINAPYGTGKSFFLERWYYSLNTDLYASLFYSAWHTDFHEHAFIPFVYSLISQMKEKQFITFETELGKNFRSAAEKLVSSLTSNALSSITVGQVKASDAKDISKAFLGIEKSKTFEAFQERLTLLKNFKGYLSRIVEQLDETGQRLVIFIDELERCRPTHAVELLECIKHLFDVKGILFIIAIDRAQLQHTISNLYGSGMDAHGYLRRFIDIELTLPNPTITQYVKYLYDAHRMDEIAKPSDDYYFGGDTIVTYMAECSKAFKLSLREIAQCFTQLNIAIRTFPSGMSFLPVMTSFLVCLKCRDATTYESIGVHSAEWGYEYFNKVARQELFELKRFKTIKMFYVICLDEYQENFIQKRYNQLHNAVQQGNRQRDEEYIFFEKAMEIREQLIYGNCFDENKKLIVGLKERLELGWAQSPQTLES